MEKHRPGASALQNYGWQIRATCWCFGKTHHYVTDRLGHDARYAIDPTKIQQELGWRPSVDFPTGLERTVDWFLNNREWLEHVTSGSYREYYTKMYHNR